MRTEVTPTASPRPIWRVSSRLAVLVVGLILVSFCYASANHLTVSTKKLGSGSTTVARCMAGSQMTFTYYLNASGDLSTTTSPYGVAVGNISANCAGGTLTPELAGTISPLPENLNSVTVANAGRCSLSASTFTCDFQVTGMILPGDVTNNYAVITGP